MALKETYLVITFYRNWFGHGQIDRHPVGHRMVEEIHEAFITHLRDRSTWNEAGRIGFIDRVSAALRFMELRREMQVLYTERKLPTVLMKWPSVWFTFVGWAMGEIDEKPVGLPPDAARKPHKPFGRIYSAMHALAYAEREAEIADQKLPFMNDGFWVTIQQLPGLKAQSATHGTDAGPVGSVVIPMGQRDADDVPLMAVPICFQDDPADFHLWEKDTGLKQAVCFKCGTLVERHAHFPENCASCCHRHAEKIFGRVFVRRIILPSSQIPISG